MYIDRHMNNGIHYQTNLATTIRISDETKKLLVRIRSEVSIKDGIDRSMEEVILYLVDIYNKTKAHWGDEDDSHDTQVAGPSYKK